MEQHEQETRILEKIKAKMDKIKANQQKIHGPDFKDTSKHFVGKNVQFVYTFLKICLLLYYC